MSSHNKGYLITFEGVQEGIGKTTQAQRLAERLRDDGYNVLLTREPGGTAIGQQIRAILLDPGNTHLSKATELMLLMADRAQHYKEVLKPGLKAGKIIICDRFIDSTLTYQGAGRGWKNAFLWRLHHATTGSLLPTITFVFNGTPHVNRKELNPDRFEREGDNFFLRVKRAMLNQSATASRYVVIDANQDIDVLTNELIQVLQDRAIISPSNCKDERI